MLSYYTLQILFASAVSLAAAAFLASASVNSSETRSGAIPAHGAVTTTKTDFKPNQLALTAYND